MTAWSFFPPGIKRIQNAFKSHGIMGPKFEEFQHGFRVILVKQKIAEGVNEKL